MRQVRGAYGLPGGVVDSGETPPMAAVREAEEETGVEVAIDYIIGTYLLRGGGWPDLFASVYKGRLLRGHPRAADEREITHAAWYSLQTLPEPLLPDARAAVPDFLSGKRGIVRDHWRTETGPGLEWTGEADRGL